VNKLAAALILFAAPAFGAEAPSPLGLREAIASAVASRLDAVLAGERGAQARALAAQSAARILPQLTATLSETRTYKENLAALGFNSAGFPGMLGPFNTFDARVRLTQRLFDWGDWRRAQAGEAAARVAAAEERSVREQVATAAALSYLEAVRAARAVSAARADKEVADGLFTLARDRKEQGSATGVDVVRAQARAADAGAALLRAQVSEREAQLLLKRVAGRPLGQELKLTDDFTAASSSGPALEESLTAAFSARAEISAAEERVKSQGYAVSAARGDRAPSVVLMGDYARSGTMPSDAKNVGQVGAALALPVFSGGLLKGRQDEAESRRRQAEAGLADVRQQVELDVRVALERVSESREEERAFALSLSLAERELSMAQDRYGAGVGASLDVVEAQAELARARSAQVSALARYHASRVNFAAAVGRASDFSL
jgi:outer membrane protein TolC